MSKKPVHQRYRSFVPCVVIASASLALWSASGVASFSSARFYSRDGSSARIFGVGPAPSSLSSLYPALSRIKESVRSTAALSASAGSSDGSLTKVPDDDDTPIAFVDSSGTSFIECFADSVVTLDGETYTIGSPCDCSVALAYFDSDEQLLPVELDSDLMDDVFPVAESIVEEEFGEELVLQRTPQTLTLVGELEEDEDDSEGGSEDDEDDDVMDDEEEVEILISFEHKGREFHLVRLLDPVLLVGKADPSNPDRRVLLTPEESDKVMPSLEELFLQHQEDKG